MKNKPFLLTPASKDYLWGGNRLNDEFGKAIDLSPLAETWECSTHPDGESLVDGVSLREILKKHPEYLGTHPLETTKGEPILPILIKLIDVKKDLSVQVHPDDEYAARFENSLGKTEMWYVLDAKPESRIVYGFNHDVNEDELRRAIDKEELVKYLNYVPIHKDDVYFIEAGIVHAIGSGSLIAEIQESSNVTYRLYDYNRVDKNGNRRPLHIERALEVANKKGSDNPHQPMRVLRYKNGCASEMLTRCKYFQVERMILNTEIHRNLATFETGANSFHVLLCVNGCGSISGEDYHLNFFKGDCVFVPADSIPLKLHGKAQLLNVSC